MALLAAHDTRLIKTGGGIVYAAAWDGNTPPEEGDYQDVGNCSGISFAIAITKLKHPSMRGSTKMTDITKVTETGYTVKFKLDEISIDNVAMLVGGTVVGNVVHAVTNPNQQYALRLVEDNGDDVENPTWDWWKCTIGADGDTNLLDLDKFKEMGYAAEGLEDSTNHPDSPLYDITFAEPTV